MYTYKTFNLIFILDYFCLYIKLVFVLLYISVKIWHGALNICKYDNIQISLFDFLLLYQVYTKIWSVLCWWYWTEIPGGGVLGEFSMLC